MVSAASLERRLGKLGTPVKTHLVFVDEGESDEQAISRYQRDHEKVIEADDVVHTICFVDAKD